MADSEIILVAESAEGGDEARALGYSIFAEADTMDELREMLPDAVRCHFDEDTKHQIGPSSPREGRGSPRLRLPRDLSGTRLIALLRHYGRQVTREAGVA